MKDMIYCKRTDCGFHSFYLVVNGQEYYLFRQNSRKGVQKYYGDGVPINAALDFSRAHRDDAIERTMTKLPLYIRYIEREYEIEVFEQTKRRSLRNCGFARENCA